MKSSLLHAARLACLYAGFSAGVVHARQDPEVEEWAQWLPDLNGRGKNPRGIMLAREQISAESLFRWKDRLFLQADDYFNGSHRRLFEVDLGSETAREVDFGPRSEFMCAAADDDFYALLFYGLKVRLLRRTRAGDLFVSLPTRTWSSDLVMGVEGSRVVIVDELRALVLENGAARSFALRKVLERFPTATPTLVRLHGNEVWLAWNRGEFGGALARLDLTTGEFEEFPELRAPLTDLAWDDHGDLWVTLGVAHMSTRWGRLAHLSKGVWSTLAETEGRRWDWKRAPHVNWEHGPTSFESLCFDRERMYMLTSTLGVVRREHDRWQELTPWWPGHVYTRQLVVEENRVLILTFDSGLLSADLETGSMHVIEYMKRRLH